MKFYYSSSPIPQTGFNRLWGFSLVVLAGIVFLIIAGAGYEVLTFIFSKSVLLGLLFVFFGLPLIGRLLFMFLWTLLSAVLGIVSRKAQKKQNGPGQDSRGRNSDVIDTKAKILE